MAGGHRSRGRERGHVERARVVAVHAVSRASQSHEVGPSHHYLACHATIGSGKRRDLASMARFEAVALVALAAACGRLNVPPETRQKWKSNRGARGLA